MPAIEPPIQSRANAGDDFSGLRSTNLRLRPGAGLRGGWVVDHCSNASALEAASIPRVVAEHALGDGLNVAVDMVDALMNADDLRTNAGDLHAKLGAQTLDLAS